MAEQASALFPPQACIAVPAYSGELGRHHQTTMHKFDAETRGESAKTRSLSLSLPRLLTATCSHATTTVGYTKPVRGVKMMATDGATLDFLNIFMASSTVRPKESGCHSRMDRQAPKNSHLVGHS